MADKIIILKIQRVNNLIKVLNSLGQIQQTKEILRISMRKVCSLLTTQHRSLRWAANWIH